MDIQHDTLPPRVLTIAGSDSGGGAGIEADLKTMAALGCYGMAAITSVTAQNTVGVFGIHDIPPEEVAKQIGVVLDDIGADAVKTGMLSSSEIVAAVVIALRAYPVQNLVVDPVMIAKSGDALLHEEARITLREQLLPLTFMLTPNIPEAEIIADRAIQSEADLRKAGEKIYTLGPRYVLMKGGHLEGNEATDRLFDGEQWHTFPGERIDTKNTHGTGCTFSAAIASYLARGEEAIHAVCLAKEYLTGAIANALPLGSGHGPLNHGWRQDTRSDRSD